MPRRLSALCIAAALAPAAQGCSTEAPVAPAAAAKAPVSRAEFGRNVVRIPGRSPADVAAAAVLATYAREQPSGWLFVPPGGWAETAVAAQFAAAPGAAAVLPVQPDHLSTAVADTVARLEPAGFRRTPQLQGLVLGDVSRHLFADAKDRDLPHLSRLRGDHPAALAAVAVPYAGGFSGRYSRSVVILSSRSPGYGPPAAAWSAFSGDTVAFVDGAEVPAETRRLLVQRRELTLLPPSIYLVGPESAIPTAAARELSRYGRVRRIPGRTPVEVAVELARYHDRATGFGWGAVRGPSSVVLMHRDHPDDAVAAIALAARGPRAPLLLTDRKDRLPVEVRAYLRRLTRSGPNHAFALGDERRFTTRSLARLDALLSRGDGHAR